MQTRVDAGILQMPSGALIILTLFIAIVEMQQTEFKAKVGVHRF